jgi:UDP-N-acetylmuramoyl-L-alanyl-D-glutamate--2,6-diaminopimelate ligase
LLDVGEAAAASGLASVTRVPGRMERIAGDDVNVIVDYSHTPDSLENALAALRETTSGGLAVVFGCGGDRDRGKRPQMGEIAARLADRVYVTSDNPRTEDPRAILDDIVAGMGDRERIVEPDRREAIVRAVREADGGDTVLVAGKGHEAYQIVGEETLPFDDAAVAREALAMRDAR